MCRSCGRRHNSVDTTTSPSGALNDGSLDSASSGYAAGGWRGGGGGSGVSSTGGGMGLTAGGVLGDADMRTAGLTMKEYDQHLARLNKENFALKLRVYFLEEKQGLSAQGAPALNKANIELKVENESLKRQLYDKQQLVSQASSAIAQLEDDYKQQLQELLQDKERCVQRLQEDIAALQQSLREYSNRCSELEAALSSRSAPAMSELTQLCDLAFPEAPTDSASMLGDASSASQADPCSGVTVNASNVANNTISNTLPATTNTLQQVQQQHQHGYSEHHHYHHHHRSNNDKDSSTVDLLNLDASLSPSKQQPSTGSSSGIMAALLPPLALQGVFSLNGNEGSKCGGADAAQLQEQIDSLEARVHQLQDELLQRDRAAIAVQQDMDNLRRELTQKADEAIERQQRVETMREEMTEQLKQINSKDDIISSLHRDLEKVEPEISIKVQEIEERDRIIEEKIGQIEQQNKILVEIQITLDEKQKQIAELEASLSEARERVQQLQADYDKSCGTITCFMSDLANRDKEIASLKRDLKKKDRKIKDLVAELKETLDMLGKAKWEAETAGRGEDSVKEMVEEEHEVRSKQVTRAPRSLHPPSQTSVDQKRHSDSRLCADNFGQKLEHHSSVISYSPNHEAIRLNDANFNIHSGANNKNDGAHQWNVKCSSVKHIEDNGNQRDRESPIKSIKKLNLPPEIHDCNSNYNFVARRSDQKSSTDAVKTISNSACDRKLRKENDMPPRQYIESSYKIIKRKKTPQNRSHSSSSQEKLPYYIEGVKSDSNSELQYVTRRDRQVYSRTSDKDGSISLRRDRSHEQRSQAFFFTGNDIDNDHQEMAYHTRAISPEVKLCHKLSNSLGLILEAGPQLTETSVFSDSELSGVASQSSDPRSYFQFLNSNGVSMEPSDRSSHRTASTSSLLSTSSLDRLLLSKTRDSNSRSVHRTSPRAGASGYLPDLLPEEHKTYHSLNEEKNYPGHVRRDDRMTQLNFTSTYSHPPRNTAISHACPSRENLSTKPLEKSPIDHKYKTSLRDELCRKAQDKIIPRIRVNSVDLQSHTINEPGHHQLYLCDQPASDFLCLSTSSLREH